MQQTRLLGDFLLWATSIPAIALAVSWGTVLGECAIAILILLPGRWPVLAWMISASLHLAIIVALGLFSFGWIMIGAVLAAAAPGFSGLFSKNERGVEAPEFRATHQAEESYAKG